MDASEACEACEACWGRTVEPAVRERKVEDDMVNRQEEYEGRGGVE